MTANPAAQVTGFVFFGTGCLNEAKAVCMIYISFVWVTNLDLYCARVGGNSFCWLQEVEIWRTRQKISCYDNGKSSVDDYWVTGYPSATIV